jgi:hypothetical protein
MEDNKQKKEEKMKRFETLKHLSRDIGIDLVD